MFMPILGNAKAVQEQVFSKTETGFVRFRKKGFLRKNIFCFSCLQFHIYRIYFEGKEPNEIHCALSSLLELVFV